MTTLALRPLALPAEHGAWAFVLEPVAVGLLVAPSGGGVAIATGAMLAFLARHPLLLAWRDRRRGRRYPRTGICEQLAFAYGAAAMLAFAIAAVKSGAMPFLPLLVAAPLAVFQAARELRNAARAGSTELAGALAPAATVASIVLAGRGPAIVALALWSLLAARAIVSTLYVRCALRGESRTVMVAAHAIAFAIAAALAIVRVVSFAAVAAMLVLLLRALPRKSLPARRIGFREVAYGVATTMLIALAG